MILQTALFNMATKGRIVCCGNVSQYDTATPEPGPRGAPQFFPRSLPCERLGLVVAGVPGLLVNNRVTMQGFLCAPTPLAPVPRFCSADGKSARRVMDWSEEESAAARSKLRSMIVEGSLKPWVNEFDGIEKGPEAFVDMLAGGNVGTTTVRVSS